ncbi:MAG: hypothetical protein KF710_11800, partial [Rhodocyclaceae bacterium]|nr:hypothetical protein [Rhodocyclaceae bacterium]MCB1901271.1 hypothetical protein [Rhodocyclaceae bacterium]
MDSFILGSGPFSADSRPVDINQRLLIYHLSNGTLPDLAGRLDYMTRIVSMISATRIRLSALAVLLCMASIGQAAHAATLLIAASKAGPVRVER